MSALTDVALILGFCFIPFFIGAMVGFQKGYREGKADGRRIEWLHTFRQVG